MPTLSFTLNAQPVTVEVRADEFLAEALRYRLGLTGTKVGCNEAECGICTVLVDGTPVTSCTYPALKAEGTAVETVEGLARDGELHPLQQAFIDHGAVQCGFCTPGMLMTAKGLLDSNPDPDDHDVTAALKHTYCRCTGYASIRRAVVDAARIARESDGRTRPAPLPETKPPFRVVGRPLPRPDAVGKVTGAARYTDDIAYPGMLHARTLRAAHPHALVKRIDTARAKALPGVHAVLTVDDVPGKKNHGLMIPDWPALADGKVRYVGDPVAIVAADTREIATEALGLIEVDYEPLPVVADPVSAKLPDAPKVHEAGNLLKHIQVRKGDVAQGFAEADVVIERRFTTPTTEHAFLETECSIGRVEDGRIVVEVGSQIPHQDRQQIADCLGVPVSQVRVIGRLIGGGFGGKEDIAGQIHAALLARATGRPVKMLYDRHESLLVHPKRHATVIRVKLGARRDGTLTAVETELYGDTGAYASLGDKVMTRATTHSAGPYAVPHVQADCYAMYTNNPPSGAFRGFGVTQSAFAVESTVDLLAETLGMDPIALRRQNAFRLGSVTNTGQVLRESVGLVECLDKVAAAVREIDPEPFAPRPVSGAPHKVRAWGVAVGYKNSGLGGGAPDKSAAEVELFVDGTAEVRTSAAEVGQGMVGLLAMVAAEELGLPADRVKVLLSDTDLTPDGGPTTASRQTYVTGNAVRLAAAALREALGATLAEKYDVAPGSIRYVEGLAQVNGHSVPLGEVAALLRHEGREPKALYEYWAPKTQPLGTGGDMHFGYSYAAQAAEVEVDRQTGEVAVLRMVVAHDVGRALNPLALQGQIEGGLVMGLGSVMTEEYVVEAGRVVTDRFARYRIPSIHHAPAITSFVVEAETAEGPFGAKGVGEVVTVPVAPAITNAIQRACGVRVLRLPVDQDRLLLALKAGRKEC